MSGNPAVTAMDTAEPAETNQDSVKIKSKDADAAEIELQILAAMRSRATYLRDKADFLTFESVRRLLEEDMGLEKYDLDVHKSFVKEHLVQCLENASNDGGSDDSQENKRKDDATPVNEVAKISEEEEAKNNVKNETDDGDDEKIKGSPENTSKMVAESSKDEGNKEALMSGVKRALRKRTSYIKANSEKITMALLRRLLEKDLKLEKHSLDPFKKFINEELDNVLQTPDAPKNSTKPKSTPSKKVSNKENSDSDDEGDSDNEEVAVKKTTARKRKLSKSKMTGKKKAKHAETDSENDSDTGEREKIAEKPLKKTKETGTAVYGKRVEHLKSVIRSCGMSVPPNIYRKVKQAPDEKREATLIKELEQILAKDGLSSNPSEKEIKEVKKRKTISKELEGIDTSNIVASSRRRSTTSFVPPPKPKITEESESDEPEESENEEENEEEEEEDEGNEVAEEGSQSEEESNNEDDGGEESE